MPARFTVSFPGLKGAVSAFRRAADHADQDVTDAALRLARDTVVVFRQAAPVKTGKLRRGIAAKRTVGGAEVAVHAYSRAGYEYSGVTRFGHRHATPDRIYPRADRFPASVVETRHARAPGEGRRPALRFVIGGRVFYRASVARYHPLGDWADKATPEVERLADAAVRRLGAKIVGRVA